LQTTGSEGGVQLMEIPQPPELMISHTSYEGEQVSMLPQYPLFDAVFCKT